MNDSFIDINLRYDSDIEKLKNCDTVIHLAGLAHGKYSKEDLFRVNVELTKKLTDKAVEYGVRRLVYISSINMLNQSDNQSSTNSKRLAFEYLKKVSASNDLEVVIVLTPLVYGSDAPGNFGLLTRLIDKTCLLPFGLTRNKRDFISVQNLTNLLVTCASHQNAAGHTFLASESETVSIKEFTNAIAKGLGKKVYQLPVPVSLMRFAGKLLGKSAMVEQLVGNLQVDSSDLKKVLGWTPPYTMEESMALLKEQSKER
ncbi:NAD-dependent epimerase/dehydratase family protein [Vibrio splendidus]|uniref:NAD-dependent epimerase/dehydratase family protein n=1 Tax=Vibrio splendidus TaxID=29497 RepID=UPI0024685D52|nr:NAD-dependent epimerase/dehydratase family protein [Vibrio splendidus]MDH5918569.1 NAD-dependent epimerase/dehydratase family protein [Vibrio splendidus]